MTLGERIYKLRTDKNLSQIDLAEQLDVSRQSVSKWETDASVPELDKLVKLCEIFGISMDELVRGEMPKVQEAPEPQVVVREVKVGTPTRVVVGAVLLTIGVLGALLFALIANDAYGLILGIPFVLCGVVCLVVKKHPVLWCMWALVLIACIYVPTTMGFNSFYVVLMVVIILVIATVLILGRKKKHETTL